MALRKDIKSYGKISIFSKLVSIFSLLVYFTVTFDVVPKALA